MMDPKADQRPSAEEILDKHFKPEYQEIKWLKINSKKLKEQIKDCEKLEVERLRNRKLSLN